MQLQFDELLIIEVESRTFLYDPRSPLYKDVSKRRSAWNEINIAIGGKSADQCRSRYEYLRGEYSRHKRSLKTTSGQSTENVPPSNPLFKQMKFLDPFIVRRKTASNLPGKEPASSDVNTSRAPGYEEGGCVLGQLEACNSSSDKTPPPPCKRQRSSCKASIEEKMDDTLTMCVDLWKKEEKDESAKYAELLAEELRNMPEDLRQFATFKHQELQYKIRAGIITPEVGPERDTTLDASYVSRNLMNLY